MIEQFIHPVDLIVCLLLSLYFITGAKRGILKTLLGPASFVLGTVIAVIFYFKTHEFLKALVVSILAPIALNILFLLVLKFWNRAIQEGETISPLSRILGGLLAVVWSGAWAVFVLIFLGMAPAPWDWFGDLQEKVLTSKTYQFAYRLVGGRIPESPQKITRLTEILQDPKSLSTLKDLKEYQDLINDPTINELLADETSKEQIKNQDFGGLLSNPKFQALLQDKELVRKIFALNEKIVVMDVKETDPSLPDAELGKDALQ